jgi:hypothetical protein
MKEFIIHTSTLSQIVISNYVNHFAHTPVDKSFDKIFMEKKK